MPILAFFLADLYHLVNKTYACDNIKNKHTRPYCHFSLFRRSLKSKRQLRPTTRKQCTGLSPKTWANGMEDCLLIAMGWWWYFSGKVSNRTRADRQKEAYSCWEWRSEIGVKLRPQMPSPPRVWLSSELNERFGYIVYTARPSQTSLWPLLCPRRRNPEWVILGQKPELTLRLSWNNPVEVDIKFFFKGRCIAR